MRIMTCGWLAMVPLVCGCANVTEDPRSAAAARGDGPTVAAPGAADARPETALQLRATDCLGRQVCFTERPQRIVSLSPNNTELLFAIGAGPQVVGVTSYCNYPAAAQRRERVGGFSDASIERIVSLEPDLVVSGGEIHQPLIAQLERLPIPVLALESESFAGLYRDIQLLGRVTGHEEQAARLVEDTQRRIDQVTRVVSEISVGERVTVFYQVWEAPLTAGGPASFLGRMIELAGGVNIIDDPQALYPKINEEFILDRDPDVILSASMGSAEATCQQLLARAGWAELRAVKNERVYAIDGDLVSRFGPRIVEALEITAGLLYPERCAGPSGGRLPSRGESEGNQP